MGKGMRQAVPQHYAQLSNVNLLPSQPACLVLSCLVLSRLVSSPPRPTPIFTSPTEHHAISPPSERHDHRYYLLWFATHIRNSCSLHLQQSLRVSRQFRYTIRALHCTSNTLPNTLTGCPLHLRCTVLLDLTRLE